jgi:two-component system chemotaxis response regulator CheB
VGFLTASVANFQAIVIACSAGGVQALQSVLSSLPKSFRVPILVVQHVQPQGPNLLPLVIGRMCQLRVKNAENGEAIHSGCVYLAPPNHHMLISDQKTIVLTESERVAFSRPSADLLFKSMADVYGQKLIAIVLTGMGKDGTAGIQAVKEAGGYVIAQDELTSAFFSMPHSAIATGDVDLVLPLEKICARVMELVASTELN